MDLKNINHLLEKYWEGTTSLEEEKNLQQYFNNGSIAPEHKEFQPLFQFFKEEKEMTIADDFEKRLLERIENESETKVRSLNWRRSIRTIAAIGILLLGVYFIFQTKSKNPYEGRKANIIALVDIEDEEGALEATKIALQAVSRKMKKGKNKAQKGINKFRDVNTLPVRKGK